MIIEFVIYFRASKLTHIGYNGTLKPAMSFASVCHTEYQFYVRERIYVMCLTSWLEYILESAFIQNASEAQTSQALVVTLLPYFY